MRPSLRLAPLVFATPLACTVYEVPDDGTGTGSSTAALTTSSGATSSGANTSTGWEPTTSTSTSGGTTTGVDPSAGPTSASDPSSASSDGTTTGDPPPAQCDFPTSIQPIFSASCGCHGGDMPPKGLVLSAGAAFDSLVGVDSMEQPGTPRVDPGDAAGSWLVTKLKPMPPVGEQMPVGGMLAANDLALIETWIDAGAPEAGAFDCGGMSGGAGSVTIDEAGPVQVEIGEMLDLDVTVLDEQGQPVMGATVKWISSDEAALYVDGKGTLLGIGPGQAQVTAEVEGVVSGPLVVDVLVSDPPATPFVDVLNTLTTNCGCHKGDMPPAALRFDLAPDLVHASLLAPATQDANSKRVVKDAPGQSYLFKKLTRTTQATGEQMPKGKAPLESEKVQPILRWITGGAPL